MFPEGIPGLTIMVSDPRSERWELYAALMVPDRNWYGAAFLPVGVAGAGS